MEDETKQEVAKLFNEAFVDASATSNLIEQKM